MPATKQTAAVRGTEIAYVEEGAGRPIVLLHGNPTSSYIWRNVIPHLRGHGRVIAPELVGHGDSSKLPGTSDARYSLAEHQAYVDALLDVLGVSDDVVLVGHDLGRADRVRLGAPQRPGCCRHRLPRDARHAVQLGRLRLQNRHDVPDMAVARRRTARPRGQPVRRGPSSRTRSCARSATTSGPPTCAHGRPPGEDRRPTLAWPRQIPIDGEPADVHATLQANAEFLSRSDIPKLYINVAPGLAMTDRERAFARTFPNQTEVTVRGLHYAQEDSPDEIGTALAAFVSRPLTYHRPRAGAEDLGAVPGVPR